MSIGTTGALILGGAAVAGNVAGDIISSSAAGKAGQAQLTAAQQQVQLAQTALQQQIQARTQGIAEAQRVSAISPGEIQSINKIFSTQEQALTANLSSIQKAQDSLNALDPQVKAAGKNLYDLLIGQSAAILKPLQTQLNYQRQEMVSNLASQMGPGWMTSSAGIEAMTKFDNNSALTLNSAQMNAIQTVGQQYAGLAGLEQTGQANITGQTIQAFGQNLLASNEALSGFQQAANRETQATIGAMSANPLNPFGVVGAQGNVVNTAGGPFAGQAAFGKGLAETAAGAGQLAGYAIGANTMTSTPGIGPTTTQIGPWAGGFGAGNMQTGAYNPSGYTGNFGASLITSLPQNIPTSRQATV